MEERKVTPIGEDSAGFDGIEEKEALGASDAEQRLLPQDGEGEADTGGRAGEVRSGTSASRYVDGSIIPAWSAVFPEPQAKIHTGGKV